MPNIPPTFQQPNNFSLQHSTKKNRQDDQDSNNNQTSMATGTATTVIMSSTSPTLQPRSKQSKRRQRHKQRPLRKPRPAKLGIQSVSPGEQDRRQARQPVHAARKRRNLERITRYHRWRPRYQQRSPRQEQCRYTKRSAQCDCLAAVEPEFLPVSAD